MDAVPGITLGILLAEAGRNDSEIRLSQSDRRPFLQPAEDGQVVALAVFLRDAGQVERSPNLGSCGEIKILRCNADHRKFLTVQEQLFPDETRVRSQTLLPESVADHRHRGHPAA